VILYAASRGEFVADVDHNRIHQRIHSEFQRRLHRRAAENEVASWRNSMQFMATALRSSAVPDDAGVSIEFVVPMTSKRVDFILTGRDENDGEVAVIVELKQWSEVGVTDRDAMVTTRLGGGRVECVHPSYQAWSYAALIEDFNETVREQRVQLKPCAFLHNLDRAEAINDPRYSAHTAKAPVFLSADTQRLGEFLSRFVRSGDRDNLLYRIEHGRIRPSKNLADALVGMLQGQPEFLMIDDQKQVYEAAVDLAHRAAKGKRQVLIVSGGPGTGKSVVAINLLVELTRREMLAQYASRNAAPRAVYSAKLGGTLKRKRIDYLFRGSGSYCDVEPATFDALIVDEAHRLTEKSGLYGNLGENQILEIIRASRFSVFFLDEDQRVTLVDIGSKEEILRIARKLRADVHELTLESQFRCAGSDGYLAFLDNALQIRDTANVTLSRDEYDFRVFDDPCDLRSEIIARDGDSTSARLVAGYCWDWKSKKNPSTMDIEIADTGFRAQWNLSRDGSLWMIAPTSVQEVGCIHTCQGLEVDYIGVIVGPDFVVRDGQVRTDALQRSSMDRSVRGIRKLLRTDPERATTTADRIIRNTYRTLMSRGRKGCFVYCTDSETREWFRSLLEAEPTVTSPAAGLEVPPGLASLPLRTATDRRVLAAERAVEVMELAIAAGNFGAETSPAVLGWAEVPNGLPASPDYFIARVRGDSMNKRIPNGAWCLFRRRPAGSLEGRILVVAHRSILDSETGAHFTIKRYRRTRSVSADGASSTVSISLEPETWADGYSAMSLRVEDAEELAVVAEFVAVLDRA
jgi:DUF2075 family protein/SOS-response transcriptional repressor LexA